MKLLLTEVEQMFTESATYSPSINTITMQIAEKIIEKNFINQCVKDKEINEKYGAILLEYLDWFLNPNDPNLNAWCPREAFAKTSKTDLSWMGMQIPSSQLNSVSLQDVRTRLRVFLPSLHVVER